MAAWKVLALVMAGAWVATKLLMALDRYLTRLAIRHECRRYWEVTGRQLIETLQQTKKEN